MITKIDGETLEQLISGSRHDIFSLKILSLFRAYGAEYDFCNFFAQKNILLAKFYGDFIIAANGEANDEDIEEVAGFMSVSGFGSVLCGTVIGEKLGLLLHRTPLEGVIMEYAGGDTAFSEKPSELDTSPSLERVYEILKTGFPELSHDEWYVDTSHRVRHGISRVLTWKNAVTATVSFELYGVALLSLLASDRKNHIKGAAAELLRTLGAFYREKGIKTQIICRRELIPFYEKANFQLVGTACTIK